LLARHALALNEGARGAALDATEALAEDRARSGLAARLQVTDFLYGRGDSTAAARAANRLIQRVTSTGVFDTGSSSSPSMSVEAASNTCVVRQWLAWSSAAPVLDSVATMTLGRASRDSSGSDLCQALVNAIDAAATRSADASQRAARVDSLVLLGVGDEELRDYVGVALSRVYIALGDNRRALEAVRRRPYMRRWPHYLAAHLELEGKIAESLGDSASAVAAYTRYLALRRSPEAESRDDVAAARAGLTRLSGSTHRTR
jgi:hypothetical protein